MFNLQTKRMIVGSTSNTMYSRFKSHLKGDANSIGKRAANYITEHNPTSWMILLLEQINNGKSNLRKAEAYWQRQFKDYLINNPIELKSIKPTKNPRHNLHNNNRVNEHLEHKYDWRKYIFIIAKTTIWHTWPTLAKVNLLINLPKLNIPNNIKKSIQWKIKNYLNKNTTFKIQGQYNLNLLPTKRINKSSIFAWLKDNIRHNCPNAYGQYVAENIKLTFNNPFKLGKLITNHFETLKNYDNINNHYNLCRCYLFPEIFKGNKSHVNIKASDLPEYINEYMNSKFRNTYKDFRTYLIYQQKILYNLIIMNT